MAFLSHIVLPTARLIRPGMIASAIANLLAVVAASTTLAQQLPQTVNVWTMGNASQNVMMATLAGIVNRNTNGELLLSPNNGNPPNPLFWLNQLKAAYPQVQSTVQSSPSALINKYRSMLSGYVLYDRARTPIRSTSRPASPALPMR